MSSLVGSPRAPGVGPAVATAGPPPAADEVPRDDLVRRLGAAAGVAGVVVLSAPAGYGKTTLLAQWARVGPGRRAWLTLGPGDDEPARLAHRIAGALGLTAPADPAALPAALSAAPDPSLLVLDEADHLVSPGSLALLSAVIAGRSSGQWIALGCRVEPDLLLGRRLAEGGLVRLGPAELAFSPAEADALLVGAGVRMTAPQRDELLRRTEGWPVGLRLAALRVAAAPSQDAAAASFGGDDRLVAAYLRETMLDALPEDDLTFLERASVLDRLTGECCDAVLGTTGSGMRLHRLEASNLLLVPLDDRGEAFRLHRLLADKLRRRLRRREPALVPDLHRRASEWCASSGDDVGAVRHALAARDHARAAALAWSRLPADLTRGRAAAVRLMVDAFDVDAVAASAPLATMAAWSHADSRADLAGHDLALAERALPAGGTRPEGLRPALLALRAMLARDGLARMTRDAGQGFRAASDGSVWRAWCRVLEGVACAIAGAAERATILLEDGVERAGRIAPSVAALGLAELALLSVDRDEEVRALVLARRSRAIVEEWRLGSYGSAALTHGVGALALALSGHPEEAAAALREARRDMAEASDPPAWLAVQVRTLVARAGIATGDETAAREALADAERFLGRLADAPGLREEVERLSRLVQPVPDGDAAILSTITAAETRVLRMLPTHHSFREIGELLYLSRFTVKSHAHALYRKLGVGSRSEAVERARQLRLLTGPAPGGDGGP